MDTTTKLRVCLAARGKIPTRTRIPIDLETLFVALAQHPKRAPKYNEPLISSTVASLVRTEAEHSYSQTCARVCAVIHAVVEWLLDVSAHGVLPGVALRAALRDVESTASFRSVVLRTLALPEPPDTMSLEHQLRIRALRVYAQRAEAIDPEDSVTNQEEQAGFAAEVLLPVLPLHVLLRVLFAAARAHPEYARERGDEEKEPQVPGEGEGEGALSPRESWLDNYRLHAPKPEPNEFSVYDTVVDAVKHGGYPLAFDCILRWPLQNKFKMLGPPHMRYSAQKGPVLHWEHDPLPGKR